MTRLDNYKKDLYELRFSPMCKPAGEVANLTMLESHSTRGRVMMLWRVAEGIITWNSREVELIYQTTLDSISEAFDVFHYPISQYMLLARADIWEAGLAPEPVRQAVEAHSAVAPPVAGGDTLLLAGEIAQLGDESLLGPMQTALEKSGLRAATWVAETGALAYALGARDLAIDQARQIIAEVENSGAQTVIADGPETAWALTKIYPALGLDWPEGTTIRLLSEILAENSSLASKELGTVLIHDSRPACLIADEMATSLAILPGYLEDETAFGQGAVYDAPRQVIEALGADRLFGTWTRSLAKSCGADDGLWLTYPDLAAGLARQRLDFVERVGADTVVTDSPLAAAWLAQHAADRTTKVKLLAELVA